VAWQKTGQGVDNIVVALLDQGRVIGAVPTDAAGGFVFDDLADGRYTARLTGLELGGFSLRATAFTPLEQAVGAGSDVTFTAVSLVPPQVVGFVTCAGQPATGATVRVVGGATNATTLTNSLGRYGATDLEPGFHTAILEGSPCAIDADVVVVELLPGQSVTVDFAGP